MRCCRPLELVWRRVCPGTWGLLRVRGLCEGIWGPAVTWVMEWAGSLGRGVGAGESDFVVRPEFGDSVVSHVLSCGVQVGCVEVVRQDELYRVNVSCV